MERKRVIAEGAGAAPLAALLSKSLKTRSKKIVLVISGGNIDFHLSTGSSRKALHKQGGLSG